MAAQSTQAVRAGCEEDGQVRLDERRRPADGQTNGKESQRSDATAKPSNGSSVVAADGRGAECHANDEGNVEGRHGRLEKHDGWLGYVGNVGLVEAAVNPRTPTRQHSRPSTHLNNSVIRHSYFVPITFSCFV